MKKFLTLIMMIGAVVFGLMVCPIASAAASGVGEVVDYSQRASWCKLPNIISQNVDTFYIYSTSYVETKA